MEPVLWTDEEGDELVLAPSAEVLGRLRLHTRRTAGVYVTAADIPEITGKLYKAFSLPSPVILQRPEVGPKGAAARSVRAWLSNDGDGVSIGIGGNADTLAPDEADSLAASIAVLAARARTAEPDPAEVDELAMALMQAHNHGTAGIGGARPIARTALRWMNKREAGS
jgi:hypothetical protein